MFVEDNLDGVRKLADIRDTAPSTRPSSFGRKHGSSRAPERAAFKPCPACRFDTKMPDRDGSELAHRLHQQAGTAGTVLVAVKEYDQAQDRQVASSAGSSDDLVKPAGTEVPAYGLKSAGLVCL